MVWGSFVVTENAEDLKTNGCKELLEIFEGVQSDAFFELVIGAFRITDLNCFPQPFAVDRSGLKNMEIGNDPLILFSQGAESIRNIQVIEEENSFGSRISCWMKCKFGRAVPCCRAYCSSVVEMSRPVTLKPACANGIA